jgi:splicing factor 1
MLKDFDKQIVTILDDNYCENCKQEGHRTWACPFEMKNKANVLCSICGETTHPTSDCPERQAYLKRQQTNQINMLLESQYSQFKSDLN